MNGAAWFDAAIASADARTAANPARQAVLLEALSGGVAEAETCSALHRAAPHGRWLLQARLNQLIGPGDPRFPTGDPAVIALDFGAADAWLRALFLPERDWFALLDAGAAIRLLLPPGTRCAAGVSRLAARFPHARFLVDAFRHGHPAENEPRANWQAQVCLAEHPNLWLTTLGLCGPRWPAQARDEALHFLVGEVGAGKLLFASGLSPEAAVAFDAPAWLQEVPFLDAAQCELILRGNAAEFFPI